MSAMRIGEFSRASGVSVRTLRFYDQAGVLRPARLNARTRYREYDSRQLADLARILALRDLGLPLGEIKAASGRPATQLLEQTAERLRRSIAAAERSLTWIESALQRPERAPAVVLRHRPPLRLASLRASVRTPEEAAGLAKELDALVPAENRGLFRGTIWHECPDDRASADVEQFVEIRTRPRVRSELILSEQPQMTVASAYSADDEEASRRAFREIGSWMAAQRLELGGAKRELQWGSLLEIQFPVRT